MKLSPLADHQGSRYCPYSSPCARAEFAVSITLKVSECASTKGRSALSGLVASLASYAAAVVLNRPLSEGCHPMQQGGCSLIPFNLEGVRAVEDILGGIIRRDHACSVDSRRQTDVI